MAKASSRNRGSEATGKQRQQSLQRRESRASREAPKETACPAELLAVAKDILSELRAIRLTFDQQRVVDGQSVTGIPSAPNRTASDGDIRPQAEAVFHGEDNGGGNAVDIGPPNSSHVPVCDPDSASHSQKSSSESTSYSDTYVREAHSLAKSAGKGKRRYLPLNVLVQIYKRFHEGHSTHKVKQLENVNAQSAHIIGDLLHQMGDMGLLEPAKSSTVTEKAKAAGRLKAPVRSWKLTDLGKKVAAYELKLREQAAGEKPASTTARGAISSMSSVSDIE